MTSKLYILLLGLSALAAVIQADFIPLKKLAKRHAFEDITREELIEYLKNLSEVKLDELSDEDQLRLVFLIIQHNIRGEDFVKRSLLGLKKRATLENFAKRSLNKREIDSNGDDELSREEFIEYLKNLTPEDIMKLPREEKIGLVFLIHLYEVEPQELGKR